MRIDILQKLTLVLRCFRANMFGHERAAAKTVILVHRLPSKSGTTVMQAVNVDHTVLVLYRKIPNRNGLSALHVCPH